MQEGKLLSQKHEGYGIGTESVKAIAEEFGGFAKFEAIGGEFHASVKLEGGTLH